MDIQPAMLAQEFDFLKGFGFTLEKVEYPESKLLEESLRLVYSLKSGFRRISVAYYSGSARAPRSVSIIIYNGEGKHFLLSDFLRAHNLSPAEKRFYSNDLASDCRVFIRSAALEFEQLCKNQLASILTGSAWEDIPFDWKGYR